MARSHKSTASLPCFNLRVFKVWNLLRKQRSEQADSSNELRACPSENPTGLPSLQELTLSKALQALGITMGKVVERAGPGVEEHTPLASMKEVNSVRVINLLLHHRREKLSGHEHSLLAWQWFPS